MRRTVIAATAVLVAIASQAVPTTPEGVDLGARAAHDTYPTTTAPTASVACDTFQSPDVECIDGMGHVLASGITYDAFGWWWQGISISAPIPCHDEDACRVVWDYETASPTVVRTTN